MDKMDNSDVCPSNNFYIIIVV